MLARDNDETHADQYVIVPKNNNADLAKPSKPVEHLSKDVIQTVTLQPTGIVIRKEELYQLEKTYPIDAFDFLVKSDILFSKSLGKSSDPSTDNPSETSKENLVAEFRSKVLGVNLFESIRQDENVILEVLEPRVFTSAGTSLREHQLRFSSKEN